MRYLIAVLLLAFEAVLQVSVVSRISLGGAAPQLVLLSVIAWSLARGPVEGIFWGFAGGLLYDLASGGTVGLSAFAMVAVAAGAGAMSSRLFGTNPLLPMLAMFIATLGFYIISSFLLATLHYPTDWRAVAVNVAFPTAIANAILSLAIYPLFAIAAAHTTRRVQVEF